MLVYQCSHEAGRVQVHSRCFPVYWVEADRPSLDQHFGTRVELRDRIILDQLIWLFWPFQQENGL